MRPILEFYLPTSDETLEAPFPESEDSSGEWAGEFPLAALATGLGAAGGLGDAISGVGNLINTGLQAADFGVRMADRVTAGAGVQVGGGTSEPTGRGPQAGRVRRQRVYFLIEAHNPVTLGNEQFWFTLDVSFDGQRLGRVEILHREGASTRLFGSSLRIQFRLDPTPRSVRGVEEKVFNIVGTWAPIASGAKTISGRIHVWANGAIQVGAFDADRNAVWFKGFFSGNPPEQARLLHRYQVGEPPTAAAGRGVPVGGGAAGRAPGPVAHRSGVHLLRLGMQGPAVGRLQEVLNRWRQRTGSGPQIPVNGRFDCATEGAVREFQAKARLTTDGVVGARTWAALRAEAGVR